MYRHIKYVAVEELHPLSLEHEKPFWIYVLFIFTQDMEVKA